MGVETRSDENSSDLKFQKSNYNNTRIRTQTKMSQLHFACVKFFKKFTDLKLSFRFVKQLIALNAKHQTIKIESKDANSSGQ